MTHLGPIMLALPFGIEWKELLHYTIEALIAYGFDSSRRYLKEIKESLKTRAEEHDLMFEDLCVRKRWPWRIGRPAELRKIREAAQ